MISDEIVAENLLSIRHGKKFLKDIERVGERLGWPSDLKIPHLNKRSEETQYFSENSQRKLREHFMKDYDLWDTVDREH